MDVSQDLADYAAKHTSSTLARPEPPLIDLGLLTAHDQTPTDPALYAANLEQHLLQLTLASASSLLSSLFALQTHSTPVGPVFRPPAPTTLLPREKPLPKPKPLTKWERFAKEKGISHKTRERDVWDEERQEWVRRWGRGGKNKEAEDQWIHEVKAKHDTDHDPAATARAERKARIAKNASQQAANASRAQAGASTSASSSKNGTTPFQVTASAEAKVKRDAKSARKNDLERSLLVSKTATASLGKFDKKIEGEPKVKGVKRKFEANIGEGWGDEKSKAMDVLKKVESGERKKVKGTEREEGAISKRKAVRHLDRQERMAKRGGRGGKR